MNHAFATQRRRKDAREGQGTACSRRSFTGAAWRRLRGALDVLRRSSRSRSRG